MQSSQKRPMEVYRTVENAIWTFYKNLDNEYVDKLFEQQESGIVNYFAEICNVATKDVSEIVNRIQRNRAQLKKLLAIPQVAQRSDEWFSLRKERLTASDTAQALNKGKFGNRKELLTKKAFPDSEKPLSMKVPPLRHGIMFEAMTARCYAERHGNININEFGLIAHPTVDCYGASPDGITDLGLMLEIKTPWKRKVDGNIPEQYEMQMQGQMAVTGLHECDYIDCEMEDYRTIDAYKNAVSELTTKDHGAIIEIINNEEHTFEYSESNLKPSDVIVWATERMRILSMPKITVKIIPWKLRKLYVERIFFDKDRWNNYLLPNIKLFWNDVLQLRANGTPPKKEFEFIDSDSDDN